MLRVFALSWAYDSFLLFCKFRFYRKLLTIWYKYNIKQSEWSVLPADPSSFLRLLNTGHISTRTCRLPEAPKEVACAPGPPACIADNKAPWHQIPCTHPLCSIPFDGLIPQIRICSNSFSLLQSFLTISDSQSPIHSPWAFNIIFKPHVCQQITGAKILEALG